MHFLISEIILWEKKHLWNYFMPLPPANDNRSMECNPTTKKGGGLYEICCEWSKAKVFWGQATNGNFYDDRKRFSSFVSSAAFGFGEVAGKLLKLFRSNILC